MEQLTLLLCFLGAFPSSLAAEVKASSILMDVRDSLDSVDTYIEERKTKFEINTKSFDVFGRPQDVQKAKEEAAVEEEVVVKASRRIPLQQVLNALPLTLIDPVGDRVMMNGLPSMKVGQTLELALGGETVLLRFEGARSTGAYFRDMKTKELGIRTMKKLAKGIQPGGQNKGAKEIQRIDLNQPQTFKLDLSSMAAQPN